jgi:hypothetical protein
MRSDERIRGLTSNGGSKSIAFGVHGLTAAVMLMTAALLVVS